MQNQKAPSSHGTRRASTQNESDQKCPSSPKTKPTRPTSILTIPEEDSLLNLSGNSNPISGIALAISTFKPELSSMDRIPLLEGIQT